MVLPPPCGQFNATKSGVEFLWLTSFDWEDPSIDSLWELLPRFALSGIIILAKRKLVNIGNKFFFLKLTHIFLSRTLIFQVFAQSPAILNNQIFHSFIQIIIQILDLILSNLKWLYQRGGLKFLNSLCELS